jgi:negative regulator of sigma E activity
MNRTIEEQLSALLDGELPAEEEALLLKRLGRDSAHRETLARYSLIGDFLRGNIADPAALGVGERVRAALDDEQAYRSAEQPLGWSGLRRGIAGIGIAATIAVIALISLNGLDELQSPTPQSIAQSQVTFEQSRDEDFSYTVPSSDGVRRAVITPARLTGYLVSHSEYANGGLSRQVMDSYVVNQTPDTMEWDEAAGAADE